jgi:hypothetical protein
LPILFLVAIQTKPVYAQGELSFVRFDFSSPKIYQGESDLYVDLNIINDGNASIKLHGAQIHFDWQATNESFITGVPKGGEPFDLRQTLAPNEEYTFRIFFFVQLTASEGYHFFEFSVFYDYSTDSSWVLDQAKSWFPNVLWSVYSAFEKQYYILEPDVADEISQAQRAGFISPQANSLLQQAKDYENDAADFASQGEWQFAVGRLQGASIFIDQAYSADQNFKLFAIVGSIIGAVAVIGVALFFRQRRKRSAKLNTNKT